MRLMLSLLALSFTLVTQPAMAQQNMPNTRPGLVPQSIGATDTAVRMAEMERMIRELNGKLEETQFLANQLRNQLMRQAEDADLRLRRLETAGINAPIANPNTDGMAASTTNGTDNLQALPEPEIEGGAAPLSEETTGQLGTVNERDGVQVGGTVRPRPPAREEGAQESYDAAFARLRQADYVGAQNGFKAFLAAYPDHPLKENAQYWLAETYYVRGQFSEAAVTFAEAYQAYPQGDKAPDNLLKLSLSLTAMKKNEDACVALNELKTRFPKGPTTLLSRASQESTRLGCAKLKRSEARG